LVRPRSREAWMVLIATLIAFLILQILTTHSPVAPFNFDGGIPNDVQSWGEQPPTQHVTLELRAGGDVDLNAVPPLDDSMTNPDYKLLPYHWYMTAEYWINPSNSYGLPDSGVVAAIEASAKAWDSQTSFQVFSYKGTASLPAGVRDGYNVIAWGSWDSDVIAVTNIWYSGRRVFETDTVMNTFYVWSLEGEAGKMDVQNIMTHEFGHWCGLDDLYNDKDYWLTMYGYAHDGETYKRTLGLGDILGLKAFYNPDLTLEDLRIEPESPRVGDTVTLYATVRNLGEVASAENFATYCYMDGKLYSYFETSLMPRTSKMLSVAWNATSGSHTVRWVTDATNVVDESNEGNNEMNLTFSVFAPSLILRPGEGPVGANVTASGCCFQPNSSVALSFNLAGAVATANTDANGSFQVTFLVPASVSGSHNVSATDALGNSAVATFNVLPSITVSPRLGFPLGTNVTVYGSGFDGTTAVNITYDGKLVATTAQDATGSFRAIFTVPVSPSGLHIVWANDSSGNNASATFKVVRIIIDEASPSMARVDVGTSAIVYFHAAWEEVGNPLENGFMYINGTEYISNSTGWVAFETSSEVVARKTWTVTAVYANGVTEYVMDASDPTVIFDRVKVVDGGVLDGRVDVGSPGTIWFIAVYEYDYLPFDGSKGTLYVNGSPMAWSVANSRWERTCTYYAVTKRVFQVSSVSDAIYGLTAINDAVGAREIVWDKVVISISVVDDRINVGEKASFNVGGYYEYDGAPWSGTYVLNDTATKNTVGKYGYRISSITDNNYGLTVFVQSVPDVPVIFDKLSITLSTPDDRIDVVSAATINYEITRQYDGSMSGATVTFNDTLTKNTVGKYAYTVSSVSGDEYGITVFDCNTIAIIFDRVQITLTISDNRIDVGSTMTWSFTAVYAYDSADAKPYVFVHLNDSYTKSVVGRWAFTVKGINETQYGLSASTSNEVYVIWDKVTFTLSVADSRVSVGGAARISVTAVYAFDNSPFKGSYSLNDTLVKTSVSKCGYKVSGMLDELYGLTAFDSNEVWIIFDKVVIVEGGVTDEFAGVGKPVTTWFKAVYAYDGKTFDITGGAIYVNGGPAEWSEEHERWEYVHKEDGPGMETFRITAVSGKFDDPITFEDHVGSKTVRWVFLESLYEVPVVGHATRQLDELFPGYGSIALIGIAIAIMITAITARAAIRTRRK